MTASTPGLLGSSRLTLAIIGFVGCVFIYTLRSDVSFAIVCMVNSTAVEDASSSEKHASCKDESDSSNDDDKIEGKLLWSKSLQGSVLSAFFWGYLFSQVIGGYLAVRYGGKIVIAVSVFLSAVLTLVCPVAANANVYLFIVIRAVLGFVQGAIFPAFHCVWSSWAPPLERGLLTGLNYAGNQIGNTITMPIAGVLCKYGFAGGWPSIFYIFGAAGVAWSILFMLAVGDTPEKHRWISKEERAYIEDSLKETTISASEKKPPVPWVKILTSTAVWGLYGGHFASDWGAYMMMTSLPMFMNDVLGLDLTSMGGIAAVPYIAYFVCINVAGVIADQIRSRRLLSTIATRRAAMIIAMGGQAVFLVASGYCGCAQQTLLIVFVTIGIGISGFAYSGFVVNYLDIAPSYAGAVLGIGNTISCIGGIVSPLIVGCLTPTGSKSEWQLVFWITAGILAVGTTIFCIFAKGEVQPWAIIEHQMDDLPEKGEIHLSFSSDSLNKEQLNESP